ncbi:MAG: acyl-CoA/acyl-ACP dehydrogenase [Deltaproteobacteria bacterium]|nr:acyl-CoA/acyl-ACP dehydrogenase [Deltaproteobacteria bacterium]
MYEHILTDEEKQVVEEARDFVRSIPSDLLKKMDAEETDYPRSFVEEAARRNLLGLRFDRRWGGRSGRWALEAAVIEEVGALGSALGCLYSLVSIVGEGIEIFGTDEQKAEYLAPMLAGKRICAEALTEPRGGSDFFGATCRAEPKGDEFILSGQKRFVVGADGADFFLVYARTDPESAGHNALSAFLVDRTDAVEIRTKYNLMGTRGGGTGRLVFHDVPVPKKNLVGELHGGGAVFNRMMVPERLTSAAGAIGTGRAALEVASKYADRRFAFGRKIRKFQGVSFQIADAVTELDAARALTVAAALQADSGRDPRRIVSEAKKFGTTAGWNVINRAMQVMGGIGYTDVYPVERFLRDARLTMIWTGTNEIMNLLIQHEYFKELLARGPLGRDTEPDAPSADLEDEKYPEE